MKLVSKEAVKHVLDKYPKLNKNRLAKMLGISGQAVNNYLNYDNKMGRVVADKMLKLFDIEITDCTYMNRVMTMDDLKQ